MPAPLETRIRIVQSRHNARLKELRSALAKPSSSLIGLEGEHLIQEAVRGGIELLTVFVRAGAEARLEALLDNTAASSRRFEDALAGTEILSVPEEVLSSVLTTETPQAMAALAVPPVFSLAGVMARASTPLILVLAALQDPGNTGTILRSAEAFGASAVLTLPGTVSIWNPKTLRSSAGSAFRIPVIAVNEDQAFEHLATHNIQNLATVAPAHPRAQSLSGIALTAPVALWLGNEGSGLSSATIARCDSALTIHYPGQVESLNAAIAASVLLYEAARQRALIQASTV